MQIRTAIASVCLAPLLLTGCWIFMPQETQTAATAPVEEPAKPRTVADDYLDGWAERDASYSDNPEGSRERLDGLFNQADLYASLFITHPDAATDLPLAEWDATIAARIEVERAYWTAAVEGLEGKMPEERGERPTSSLTSVHGLTVVWMIARNDELDVITPEFVLMLTVDRIHDDTSFIYAIEGFVLEHLEVKHGREAAQAACRQAVDAMPKKAKHQRNVIMLACEWPHYETWREDLAMWATKGELKAFTADLGGQLDTRLEKAKAADAAAIAAMDERRRRQEEDDRAAQDSWSSGGGGGGSGGGSGGGGGSTSTAPSVVSVTVRNSCSSTVKVFFGDNPKFGSGRQSSLGGNSRQSQQMKPGDTMWIIDDSSNGLASATVSGNTREIEVSSSCTSISAR
ncbi:hypothetical protein [Enhygromyxa salina]|uniref:Uncharacterized protein n=1 Tax=Enhygromyxa salina TaxID=215803 RepID=A0A2S9YVF4_9BACT|nr:hypothetical protein [Enhygromyxa salina]PRQ09085.1 hypothetical protein ENSA7_10750 [Enhygromyxa salina]